MDFTPGYIAERACWEGVLGRLHQAFQFPASYMTLSEAFFHLKNVQIHSQMP
jgi:hypothetical protein